MDNERQIKERVFNKERRWESPSLKELKEKRNNFQDNKIEVINFFRLLLLQKTEEKRSYFSFSDAKDLFQSTELSDEFLLNLKNPYEIAEERIEELKYLKLTPAEREKDIEAAQKSRSLRPVTSGKDKDGYLQGPKVKTDGSGIIYTNQYREPGKQPMKLEGTEYRVNLALTQDISNLRVLMDLYEALVKNPILAERGFQMKSLGNNRTDAIIIYCGENGVAPTLTEVGNYCLKENIGDVPGVPFGVAPLTKYGWPLKGLRITSNPDLRKNHDDYYTFNDLQVTALTKTYETVVHNFLQKTKSAHTFKDADQADLHPLHKQLAKQDEGLMRDIEKEYAYELEKICGKGANLHNLAFPVIK